jgi:hypothetical protein
MITQAQIALVQSSFAMSADCDAGTGVTNESSVSPPARALFEDIPLQATGRWGGEDRHWPRQRNIDRVAPFLISWRPRPLLPTSSVCLLWTQGLGDLFTDDVREPDRGLWRDLLFWAWSGRQLGVGAVGAAP